MKRILVAGATETVGRQVISSFPIAAVDMLLNAWAAAIGQPALVTSKVPDFTGNPARSFKEWVIDNVAEFRHR